MAAPQHAGRRLMVVAITALSALVIVAPSIDERLGVPVTPQSRPAGTEAWLPATMPEPSGGIAPGAMATLPDVVDSSVRRLMAELHAPGTAVAIVHEGRVLLLRGYGVARVETNTPVDAATTLFRIGSVTKPLTAAAVLQFVDEGALDLSRDIRAYLPDLSLRHGVTAHQLLTHTAGFDEKFAGGFTREPEDLQPLAEHVMRQRPRSRRCRLAVYYSYNNTNYSLAGRLVERLSGRPYEDAMAARLFTPLKMTPHDGASASRGRAHRRPRASATRGTERLPCAAVPLHAEPSGRRGEHDRRRHEPLHAGAAW